MIFFKENHCGGQTVNHQLLVLCTICLIWLGCQSAAWTAFAAPGDGTRAAPQMSLEEFVHSIHPHGVSVSAARTYKPTTDRNPLDKLEKMLSDSSERSHWSTIVVTLAIIGDSKSGQPIINFIEKLKKQPTLSTSDFRTLKSAYWGLGILINQAGDQARYVESPQKNNSLGMATTFLINKINDKKESHLSRQSHPIRSKADTHTRRDHEKEAAILGLAFSATKEAKTKVTTILKESKDKRFRSWLNQVNEARDTIDRRGLLCYREPKHLECEKKPKQTTK